MVSPIVGQSYILKYIKKYLTENTKVIIFKKYLNTCESIF